MQQPQWSPPPQQPAGWGAPGYGGPPPRPLGVTLGGIFLIVMGVLWVLGGAACAIGGAAIFGAGSSVGDNSGLFGAAGSIVIVLAIFGLVIGILQIAAGAGSIGGRGWGRWMGIVISIINNSGGTTGGIGGLVVGVLYALTAYALISAGSYFAYRR